MPSKLRKAIGAVKDQTSISLAKVSNNHSSNVEVVVLKATTHEDVPIDEKYVQEVLYLVSSNKAHAATCARAIGKRISRTRNWIVALKSLMLVLRLFQDGDPYFPREVLHAMKRGGKILNLSSFRDDSNSSPWDYTAFVRTFALYLDERLDCFLTGKLQRRYTTKDRDRDGNFISNRGSGRRGNEPVRDMKPPMLLDRISFWQRLLERAIGTRPTGVAKTNRLVQICLYAVVQESFDLYKDISDGLALVLDSFFHLQYNSCVVAFQTCVKASKQFEELNAFYTLCKKMSVGRTSEYPSIQTISEELIETLQEFLKDQSSFPARSPGMPVELPETGSSSSRRDYYEGSEYSETSTERCSVGITDNGSQSTSLEDLISATESGRNFHNRSIDLEDYSDQFEQKSQGDDTFRVSNTGSTHSLPASTSMADLVSLDDWPESEQNAQQSKKVDSATGWELVLADVATQWPPPTSTVDSKTTVKGEERKEDELAKTSSGWELVLADVATQWPPPTSTVDSQTTVKVQERKEDELAKTSSATSWDLVVADSSSTSSWNPQTTEFFDNFNSFSANNSSQPVQESKNELDESNSSIGWELVLAETATRWTQQTPNLSNTFDVSSLDSLYNQTTPIPTSIENLYSQNPISSHHYNPFLQEPSEIPAVPTADMFGSAPTFQAGPTFCAQNQNDDLVLNKNDPFNDPFGNAELFDGSANQQSLMQEQQSWLEQQNKIIAKHMS